MTQLSNQTFVVKPDQAGSALAGALRAWLPGTSWSQVKDLIRARKALVNDVVCIDEGRRLRAGDSVRISVRPEAAPPSQNAVVIRHVDRHVVVVEKPAGMRTVCHPTERTFRTRRRRLHPALDDLLPELIQRYEERRYGRKPPKASAGKGVGRSRVRVVHRIDRDTSGLLVFARTSEAEENLVLQFKAHSIDRVYLAVADGHVQAQTFESYLVDDRGDGRRGSTTLPDMGKRAVTHVRPIEALANQTFLECRLETGRTHQIRIHLSEAGHPLCGDRRYHQPLHAPALPDTSGAPRLALHATRLGFLHPAYGTPMTFDAALPADLAAFLGKLRNTAPKLSS